MCQQIQTLYHPNKIEELKKKFGITELKQRNSILSESSQMYEDLNDELIYKKEINNLVKEIDLCKKRRDIAFIERDKVLRERESIRALCDELRHQRDKSISELADSLRENDDLKKEKSMAIKQIQMMENKLVYYEDKLITYREEELKRAEKKGDVKTKRPGGHTNLSKSIQNVTKSDSKMGKSEDNHRILKIEIDLEENPELGVEFSYATYEFDDYEELKEFQIKNQSNNLIIVNSVDPESISYGKLKKNENLNCSLVRDKLIKSKNRLFRTLSKMKK
ncbi:disks large -like protein [Brachionus plicatilis]|uniref:Disks large-like protein n=1 Tax=Brachionus plicatilis TaxID=10195 RepID=A0A3M7RL02_BRAPC|nr:disks large -like protein [Brachionus plicatilis]